jgi:hypothetical protein
MKHRGTGKRKGGPKGHDHDALVIDGPPAAARPQGAGPDKTRHAEVRTELSSSTEEKATVLQSQRYRGTCQIDAKDDSPFCFPIKPDNSPSLTDTRPRPGPMVTSYVGVKRHVL